MFSVAGDGAKTCLEHVHRSDLLERRVEPRKVGLPREALEAAIGSPFSLGYIFGVAAWHSDRWGVPRPSPDADGLVLSAYKELLGPIRDDEVQTISADAAAYPTFQEGIAAAAAELDAVDGGNSEGAWGLARFLLSP